MGPSLPRVHLQSLKEMIGAAGILDILGPKWVSLVLALGAASVTELVPTRLMSIKGPREQMFHYSNY